MLKKITIWVLLTTVIFAANAQKNCKITGKIIDGKTGGAVEYATVSVLKASDSSLANGSITASNGSFSVNNLAAGNYLVRVSFIGYKTLTHPSVVTLSAAKPSVDLGKIKISQSAVTLEAAVVRSERSMVDYQLDKRVVNVDKNIVTGGGTATDVLENVPSVSIDNDGNVSLRGSTNVSVLINGRPYELMGNDLETLLEQIPASTVENVEVITNPSAKYDPEGMSGIINLKLKEKTAGNLGLNGIANLNLGSPLPQFAPTAMGSLNLNYTTEKYNVFFTADGGMRSRAGKSTTYIRRYNGSGAQYSEDSLYNENMNSNIMGNVKIGGEYFFDDKNSLLVSYQFRDANRRRRSSVEDIDLFNANKYDYTQTDTNDNKHRNHTVNLCYTRKFDNKDQLLTFDVTYNHRKGDANGLQEQLYDLDASNLERYYLREAITDNENNNGNIKLDYTHPINDKLRLETGYEGRIMQADQNYTYYLSQYDNTSNLSKELDDRSSTHFVYTQQIHAAYATLAWKATQKLSTLLGLRGEYSEIGGEDKNHQATTPVDKTYWLLYPTLHLSYAINDLQSIQLSYSRRVRRPHMHVLNPYMDVREGNELSFGNPSVDPELTNSIEVSYNFGIKSLNVFTSAYFRQTNNMMTRYGFVWDSETSGHYASWLPYNSEYDGYWASTWQNLSKGVNYGLELILDYQIAKWWKVNLSVNLFESRIEGTELLDNQDKEAFRASGKFSSYMMLPKDWTIQLSGQYNAPFMDLQTDMLATYWADLAVKKDILQKRATINLRVGDVFCTGGFGHTTDNEQLYRQMRMKRLSPTVTVGFSYKINNGLKPSRKRNADMDDDGGDSEY